MIVLYRHGCPVCGGRISSDELANTGRCSKCSNSLETGDGGKQLLQILIKEVEDFENFFTTATYFKPLPLQVYWIKRLFFGDSFALIAPTGVGKSTLLAVYALYRAYFYGNKVYIVTPTREIAKQFYVRVCNYIRNMRMHENSMDKVRIVFYDSTARNVSEVRDAVRNGAFDILITSAAFLSRHYDAIVDKKIDIVIADDLDSILKNSKNVDRLLRLLGFNDSIIEKTAKLVRMRQNLIVAKSSSKLDSIEELKNSIADLEAEIRNEISKRRAQLVVASATGRVRGLKSLILRELLGFDTGAMLEYWRNIADLYSSIDSDVYMKILKIVRDVGSGIIFYSNMYKEYIGKLHREFEKNGIKFAVAKSGNRAVDKFRRGDVDVLIGSASYYGILVRGLDEPLKVRFTVFIGVPQIVRDLYDSLNNIRFLYVLFKKLEELGVELSTLRRQLTEIVQRSTPALLMLYSKLLKNPVEVPQDLADNIALLQLIKNQIYSEVAKMVNERGKLVIDNYCIIVEHGGRLTVIKPDPYTYIQASGRASRLFNGYKTFGLSIVFEKHKELIDILEYRLKRLVNFNGFRELDLKDINEHVGRIEMTRKHGNPNDIRSGISTALIVVESPTKAKTIATMFGRPAKRIFNDAIVYETIIPVDPNRVHVAMITATLGHIVDLVTDEGIHGVKVEQNRYVPVYDFIARCRNCGHQHIGVYDSCPYCGSLNILVSSSICNVLRRLALEVDKIFIATDPDTEGEKISFDVKSLLLPYNKNIYRIEFREITRSTILESLRNCRDVENKKVEAQIARRIADRWIGFEVSLWLQNHFNKPWLGAGRVQTPILLWNVERYREYRERLGYVIKFDMNGYKGRLYLGNGVDGEHIKKIVSILNEKGFEVSNVSLYEKTIPPPPPYTTDALLSDASNFLGFTASKTMYIAQILFEMGLVTYHRTDSTRVSSAGITVAREALNKMGLALQFTPRTWDKDIRGENAHEAIRPTHPYTSDELIEMAMRGEMGIIINFSKDHIRLYDLIFRRFVASQMGHTRIVYLKATLRVESYSIDIEVPVEIIEEGFTRVFKMVNPAPQLRMLLNLRSIKPSSVVIDKGSDKGLYRVADLIKLLKEHGVGRPSTYAKAIDNNIRHGYIILSRKRKVVIPTKLGIEVANVIKEHFENIVGVNSTRDLEKLMDYVEEGRMSIYEAINRIKNAIDAVQTIFDAQSFTGLNINIDLALTSS